MKTVLMLAVVLCGACLQATPYVTNVVAKQRYPWNGKVDIDYEIVGDVERFCATKGYNFAEVYLRIEALDMTRPYTIVEAKKVPGVTLAEGCHHVVWDLNEDNVSLRSPDVKFQVSIYGPEYCIIDIGNPTYPMGEYPVTYTIGKPVGGWTDEYKTSKLVLRRIGAGRFGMGGERKYQYQIGEFAPHQKTILHEDNPAHDVILTRDFYIGVFEVTQKQWELVMKSGVVSENPVLPYEIKEGLYDRGDKLPIYLVSYDQIRGSENSWPESSGVSRFYYNKWQDSFMLRLAKRTGLSVDLPTEAQWEYACGSGTNIYYSGSTQSDLDATTWYSVTWKENKNKIPDVGRKLPNKYGLYDMQGLMWEWCLDWDGALPSTTVRDPVGANSGSARILKGGSCRSESVDSYDWASSECVSVWRISQEPSADGWKAGRWDVGFRVALTVEE